ncbi:hypothetical protein LCGC14_1180870 [marine sediment metagenome]|uniref:Uncharacterized protein n=1 Tax=marine sediment metagenome TaxID=412755 RepID=A0A0F9LM83_9ZZZZ
MKYLANLDYSLFIILLGFCTISFTLYVSYRYNYNCQSCGSHLRNKGKVY